MSSKNINEIVIQKNNIRAGVLRRTKDGAEFVYDQEYFSSKDSEAVSFGLPKSQFVHAVQGENLHPYFAGLLPEGLRLKAITEKLKTSPSDYFSIFAEVGFDCIGDVTVQKDTPKLEFIRKWADVDFYEYFFETLKSDYLENTAFAGVQEKISASMISLPIKGSSRNKSYILKLNSKDKPRLIYNEYYCLELAKKCGLKVNKTRLIPDKNKNHGLLVERFDRLYNIDQKKLTKIHQEDACQFLNQYPANKYRLSFREILEQMNILCTSPKIEILKAIEQYIFSYLICNGDMHAKNISIMVDPKDKTIVLTPAYDLISTLVYGDENMALKIDGKDKKLNRKIFVSFAEAFDIPSIAIESKIEALLKNVSKNKGILKKIGFEEKKEIYLFKNINERLKSLS
ncbi:MAG: HipA domain-containing protein [Bdellovibrionota bacterium]